MINFGKLQENVITFYDENAKNTIFYSISIENSYTNVR